MKKNHKAFLMGIGIIFVFALLMANLQSSLGTQQQTKWDEEWYAEARFDSLRLLKDRIQREAKNYKAISEIYEHILTNKKPDTIIKYRYLVKEVEVEPIYDIIKTPQQDSMMVFNSDRAPIIQKHLNNSFYCDSILSNVDKKYLMSLSTLELYKRTINTSETRSLMFFELVQERGVKMHLQACEIKRSKQQKRLIAVGTFIGGSLLTYQYMKKN